MSALFHEAAIVEPGETIRVRIVRTLREWMESFKATEVGRTLYTSPLRHAGIAVGCGFIGYLVGGGITVLNVVTGAVFTLAWPVAVV